MDSVQLRSFLLMRRWRVNDMLSACRGSSPAVPDADRYPNMAAEDVCASCAAHAGIQAPVMRAKPLHLYPMK